MERKTRRRRKKFVLIVVWDGKSPFFGLELMKNWSKKDISRLLKTFKEIKVVYVALCD